MSDHNSGTLRQTCLELSLACFRNSKLSGLKLIRRIQYPSKAGFSSQGTKLNIFCPLRLKKLKNNWYFQRVLFQRPTSICTVGICRQMFLLQRKKRTRQDNSQEKVPGLPLMETIENKASVKELFPNFLIKTNLYCRNSAKILRRT